MGDAQVGLEPFPDLIFEKFKNLYIWEKVLQCLTDPKDFTNARSTCPLFNEILDRHRADVMLPNALCILKTKGHLYSKDKESDSKQKLNCLELRRVSQAWKKATETAIFESCFFNNDWFLKINIDDCTSKSPEICILRNSESLDKAIRLFKLSSSSLLRKLCVVEEFVDSNEILLADEFHRKLIKFLRIHGKSVWLFNYVSERPNQIAEAYLRVLEMLKWMPNLKALILDGLTTTPEAKEIKNLRDKLKEQDDSNSFPNLDSLKHLHCVDKEDEMFLIQILQKCRGTLKSVIFHEDQYVNEEMETLLKKQLLERYNMETVHDNSTQALTSLWFRKKLGIVVERRSHKFLLYPNINPYKNALDQMNILDFAGSGSGSAQSSSTDPFTFDYTCPGQLELPNLRVLRLNDIRLGLEYHRFDWERSHSLCALEKVLVLPIGNITSELDEDGLARVKAEVQTLFEKWKNLSLDRTVS